MTSLVWTPWIQFYVRCKHGLSVFSINPQLSQSHVILWQTATSEGVDGKVRQAGPTQPMLQKWLPKKESDNEGKKNTSPFTMPGHWYFTFIPSSWEDRAKPGFLILLFRGHGKWFGAVVECWRISVVTVHPQRGSWGFLFIIQTVRHFQWQLIAQLLQNRRRKQELRKKRP